MKLNLAVLALSAFTFIGAAVAQPNAGVHLTDGDAVFDYALAAGLPTSSNGGAGDVPINFQLAGPYLAPNTNWTFSGNWFYRIQGDDRERHFDSANQQILTGSNEVEYVFPQVYTVGNAVVPGGEGHMAFHVFDTGLNRARLNTEACIVNSSNVPIFYSTYAVFDVNIMGTFLGDTWGPTAFGSPIMLSGTDGPGPNGLGKARMIGGGTAGGVGSYGLTMGQMTDGNIDILGSMNPLGFGPGTDGVAYMQFDGLIAPPQSSNCTGISLEIDIEVPEPATLTMLLPAIMLLRRRR